MAAAERSVEVVEVRRVHLQQRDRAGRRAPARIDDSGEDAGRSDRCGPRLEGCAGIDVDDVAVHEIRRRHETVANLPLPGRAKAGWDGERHANGLDEFRLVPELPRVLVAVVM